MAKTKPQLLEECTSLGIETEGLDTNAKLAEAIAIKKQELDDKKVNSPEEVGLLTFKIKNESYTFSDRCPKKLQVNNKVYTKEELLNHEDELTFLVVGNSVFIKKL